MGWVTSKAYQIGKGPITRAIEVVEPAGYTGEWLTDTNSVRDPLYQLWRDKGKSDADNPRCVRFARRDRQVFGTKRQALHERVTQ